MTSLRGDAIAFIYSSATAVNHSLSILPTAQPNYRLQAILTLKRIKNTVNLLRTNKNCQKYFYIFF